MARRPSTMHEGCEESAPRSSCRPVGAFGFFFVGPPRPPAAAPPWAWAHLRLPRCGEGHGGEPAAGRDGAAIQMLGRVQK
jgi:hypothetical protein